MDGDVVAELRKVERPTALDLAAAGAAVARHLRPTPLIKTSALGERTHLKVESLQPTNSFKPRGAIAALTALPRDRQIVLSSAGNAAVAVAWAAKRMRRAVRIVVPQTASPLKLAKISALGAQVELAGDGFDAAEQHALEAVLQTPGSHYLSSYNDTDFIAGLATLGAELEALDGPVTIVVPVGGGGLASGICCWAARRPHVRVVGVQAARSPAMGEALKAGYAVPVDVGSTVAEGLAGNIEAGAVTIDILRDRLDALVDVGEDAIEEAIRFLSRECGLVAEGAGAVATAALLEQAVPASPGATVCVLSGANIAPPLLASVLGDRQPVESSEAETTLERI